MAENEDDHAREERWRIFLKKDTSTSLRKLERLEKLVEEVSEKVSDSGALSFGASGQSQSQLTKIEGKLDSEKLSKIASKIDEHQTALNDKLERINDGVHQQFHWMQEELKSNSERIANIEVRLQQEGAVARVLKI